MSSIFDYESETSEGYFELGYMGEDEAYHDEEFEMDPEGLTGEFSNPEWEEESSRRRIPFGHSPAFRHAPLRGPRMTGSRFRPSRLRSHRPHPGRAGVFRSPFAQPPARFPYYAPPEDGSAWGTIPGIMPSGAQDGEYIRWIQDSLNRILNLRLPVNGVMGVETRSAVRSFQEQQGLPVTGLVDPNTEQALTAALAAPAGESFEFEKEAEVDRDSSTYVMWVQQSLNKIMSLKLAVDGVTGPMTRSAVRSFQSKYGLTVDGIVGPQTEAALVRAGASKPPTGETTPGYTPPAGGGSVSPLAQLSGAQWVKLFPTSRTLDSLVEPFRNKAVRFVNALKQAGANVSIAATRRPPERAYLMHYAWKIAKDGLSPTGVPGRPGLDIQWAHRSVDGSVDLAASRRAAQDMVNAYSLRYEPALSSKHIDGKAIDMSISWTGNLTLPDGGTGAPKTITSIPRTGADNRDLHALGSSYGVTKLVKDPPHWSDNGH